MGSPIFGSFVIAWLCWNHRYFVILFSDLPIEYRFQLASRVVYPAPWGLPTWTGVIPRGFLWPALSSLAYILVYPPASKGLLAYWERWQTEIDNQRKVAQRRQILTREEADAILVGRIEERDRFTKQIGALTQEIEALRRSSGDESAGKKLVAVSERLAELERALSTARAENEVLSKDAELSLRLKEEARLAADKETEARKQMTEVASRAAELDQKLAHMRAQNESLTRSVNEIKSRDAERKTATQEQLHPLLKALVNQRISTGSVAQAMKLSPLRASVLLDAARGAGLVATTGAAENYLTPAGRKYVVDQNLDRE